MIYWLFYFSVSSGNGEKAWRRIIPKRRPVPLFFAGLILSHNNPQNGKACSMLICDKSGLDSMGFS